jgi:hypothetical protein
VPKRRHLVEVHQPGVVVLVPGKGQAVALDRVGDKAGRPVVLDGVEGGEDRVQVVAGEVGHQPLQCRVVVAVEDRPDPGIAVEVAPEMLAPAFASLVNQRRIERVRAGVDPFTQMMPVGPGEGGLQEPPVSQRDNAPAHHFEHRVDAAEETIGDHRVEALAVVVDDPPEIADVVLPAFEQRLEDIALVELGVAGQCDHAAGRIICRHQALETEVVLGERGEQGHADAEPDRPGREIDGSATRSKSQGLDHGDTLSIAQICAMLRYDGPRIREKNPEARPQAGCRCLLR